MISRKWNSLTLTYKCACIMDMHILLHRHTRLKWYVESVVERPHARTHAHTHTYSEWEREKESRVHIHTSSIFFKSRHVHLIFIHRYTNNNKSDPMTTTTTTYTYHSNVPCNLLVKSLHYRSEDGRPEPDVPPWWLTPATPRGYKQGQIAGCVIFLKKMSHNWHRPCHINTICSSS